MFLIKFPAFCCILWPLSRRFLTSEGNPGVTSSSKHFRPTLAVKKNHFILSDGFLFFVLTNLLTLKFNLITGCESFCWNSSSRCCYGSDTHTHAHTHAHVISSVCSWNNYMERPSAPPGSAAIVQHIHESASHRDKTFIFKDGSSWAPKPEKWLNSTPTHSLLHVSKQTSTDLQLWLVEWERRPGEPTAARSAARGSELGALHWISHMDSGPVGVKKRLILP